MTGDDTPDHEARDQETAPRDEPPAGSPRRQTHPDSVLAAAMLAVGKVLEPEKTTVEITVEAAQPHDSPGGLQLDFGELPDPNDL